MDLEIKIKEINSDPGPKYVNGINVHLSSKFCKDWNLKVIAISKFHKHNWKFYKEVWCGLVKCF